MWLTLWFCHIFHTLIWYGNSYSFKYCYWVILVISLNTRQGSHFYISFVIYCWHSIDDLLSAFIEFIVHVYNLAIYCLLNQIVLFVFMDSINMLFVWLTRIIILMNYWIIILESCDYVSWYHNVCQLYYKWSDMETSHCRRSVVRESLVYTLKCEWGLFHWI